MTLRCERLSCDRLESRLTLAAELSQFDVNVFPAGAATAPTAPYGVAVSGGDSTATVTWSTPSSNGGAAISGYRIRRSSDGGLTYKQSTTSTTATSITFTTTECPLGTTWAFCVAAYNSVGTSTYSAWSGSYTVATTPGAVTDLVAMPRDGGISLSWSPPASDGYSPITDYRVTYNPSPSGTWGEYADGVSASPQATLAGLTNGITYYFKVYAVNRIGTATGAAYASATGTPGAAPSAPRSFAVAPGDTSAALTWSAPSHSGGYAVSDYEIQYAAIGTPMAGDANRDGLVDILDVGTLVASGKYDSGVPALWDDGDFNRDGVLDILDVSDFVGAGLFDGGLYLNADTAVWSTYSHPATTATSLQVSGLARDAFYVFRIAGRNVVGVGSWSAVVGPLLPLVPISVPDSPSAPSASAGNAKIVLSWSQPASNGSPITDYTIQYSSNAGATWSNFPHTPSSSVTAAVTGLVNGTAYVFRVAAVNSIGAGVFSAISISATPSEVVPVPSAPTNVVAAPGNGQLTVTWTASSTPAAVASYRVDYSTDSGGTWTTGATTVAVTSAVVAGLTNGDSYWVRVAAVNADGVAATSSITLPAIPVVSNSANELWHNQSPGYAIAVWTAVDQYGVGLGAPVVMNAGRSAYPVAYAGGSKTLYLAIASSTNLVSGWYTVVDPNLRVTIPDAQQITFWVDGWTGSAWQVSVNNRKTSPMY